MMRTRFIILALVPVVVAGTLAGCGDNLEPAAVVDTSGPPLVLLDRPADPSNDPTPRFTFRSTDATAAFECQIDGVAAFAACSSPFTPPALGDGPQTFRLRATDPARHATALSYAWTVDTIAPTVAVTGGPSGAAATPAFEFTVSSDATAVACAVDGAAFAPCTSPITVATLGLGAHTFTVRAEDAAGNIAAAALPFVVGVCGDATAQGTEQCDGADLRGQSCAGLAGFAGGTLACTADCRFDTRGCNDGFTAENTGFSGKVCFDGVKFSAPVVAACTEDTGVWRLMFDDEVPEVWTNLDGSVAGQQVVNLHGRAVIPGIDGPATVFLVDNSGGPNSYRSNLFASTTQPMAWPVSSQVTFATGGLPIEMFSAKLGSSVNNALGGWHPTLGAVVLHGNAGLTATVSAVGPTVTGTVTSITSGSFSLPSTDIHIAVFGKTPAGAPATGGGIYWTCDQLGTAGGTYLEHDTGIPDGDKPLVATLLPDPASLSPTARACPTTGGLVGGFATTYFAGLRGGGQIYKTTDGGAHWEPRNTGLPAGAEVYALAIDCERVVSGFPNLCNNHDLVYAATSLGLYRSTDAGAHWTLAGLAGKVVRGVTLENDHPAGTAPRVIVGVDDDVKIYQKVP